MSDNSERKFDPNDPYTATMLEWIHVRIIHTETHHGGHPNTLLIPISIWENMGRPMRIEGLRVIPFTDLCKKPIIWVGNTPEELKL